MSLSYNEQKESRKNPALEKARKELKNMDPDFICQRTGIKYSSSDQCFYLPCFNKVYQISYPEGKIVAREDQTAPPRGLKIILLHFLLQGNNAPPRDKFISFKELPQAKPYAGPFHRQAIKPVIEKFGRSPEKLKKAALKLQATLIAESDFGFTIDSLPTVPITYLVWFGDEEMEGGANLVFDQSIISKLHSEDISFLGEFATDLLIKSA